MEASIEKIWQQTLRDIEGAVTRANYLTLFKNTHLLSYENDQVVIAAPSMMIVDLLQKRFYQLIKATLDKQTGKNITISFITKTIASHTTESIKKDGPLFTPEEKPASTSIGHLPRVRPEYTFQNFAVSSTNQLAFVSATTVAGNIGNSYNPFFIYGPVGVGKTHLMHAIANAVYQATPERKIIYITSEEFTNEVVEAIRNNDTGRMKKRFRTSHLLLIDDIQFVEGKERVQEELFHTFNILIDNGAQICLSSDRPPHEIKKLEKRLSSRFAGGLTVDIEAPDFELKTAILLKKAEKYGRELPIDVAKILAERAEDTRSLEGLLLRLITLATTTNNEITLELAMRSLGIAIDEKKERLHVEDIIKSVCSFYNVKPTQLKGPKRDASLVRARQITMFLLKTELELTYVEIGNVLGGRDHTTIMHGVEKIEGLREKQNTISADIMGITRSFKE